MWAARTCKPQARCSGMAALVAIDSKSSPQDAPRRAQMGLDGSRVVGGKITCPARSASYEPRKGNMRAMSGAAPGSAGLGQSQSGDAMPCSRSHSPNSVM